MRKRHFTRLGAIVAAGALALLALAAPARAGYERVDVKTADKSGAGTDSNIDLELWGTLDGRETYSGKIRLNPLISGDAFERNSTNTVLVLTVNLGGVHKLKVTSDGRYAGSAWDLEWIQVQGRRFAFNRNLDGNSAEVALDPVAPPPARPVYVIAHECNSAELASQAVGLGANAIEADFMWDSAGKKWVVQHPKDVFDKRHVNPVRTELEPWLAHVRGLAEQSPERLALIYFDIKKETIQGEKLSNQDFTASVATLYGASVAALPKDLNAIFSTGEFADRTGFDSIQANLPRNHGLAIDYHNSAEEVANHFQNVNVNNVWYANGITSLLPEPGNLGKQLQSAVSLRDSQGRLKKAGSWTYERESSIHSQYFDRNLDFVLVEPAAIAATVKMVDGGLLRLARRRDDPFTVYRP